MRVAIPSSGTQVAPDFFKAESVRLYTAEGKILLSEEVSDVPEGVGVLDFVESLKPDAVVAGSSADGVKEYLSKSGIKVYTGIEGGAEAALMACIWGYLEPGGMGCSGECASCGSAVTPCGGACPDASRK